MSRLSSQSIFEGVEALKQIVRPVEKRRNILQERRTHRKDGAVTMRRRFVFSCTGIPSSKLHKLTFVALFLYRTKAWRVAPKDFIGP